MNAYFIGEILKEYRTRFEISQDELSFGLCAVSTLSRIESGTQIPGRKLAEALFSKMGMKTPSSATPMSRLDFKRENLEHKIIDSIANGNFDVFDTLEEYKSCGKTLDPLEKQFYIFYKAIAQDALNHNAEKALKEYIEAINLSIKDFSLDDVQKIRFLTRTELMILNNISRALYFSGKKDKAISLMEFLRNYYETREMGEEEMAKGYPVILLNLENWYGDEERFQEALELSEIGIEICIKYGKLTPFPCQLFNKGCSLVKLNRINEGKKFLSQAFSVFEAMNLTDEMNYGKKWVAENLKIIF